MRSSIHQWQLSSRVGVWHDVAGGFATGENLFTRREFLASSAALALSSIAPLRGERADIVPLGKLDPFWRYSAALGPYLEIGNGLMTVPDYMLLGDFPYRKRSFPQEVLFADGLSIVRLLGGYLIPGVSEEVVQERDLAFRDADGKICYRPHLLKPRLQPYLDQGYTDLTLVLDNVPYCFPEKPVAVGLGQIMPPRDPEEWKQFIREVARWIVDIFGPEGASRLRFRVGTENNSTDRWGGTQAQYIQHYKDSAAAVLEIIPQARISFYNISSAIVQQIPTQNVNSFALAESCYRDQPHAPIDFIAFSSYYWQENDPEQTAAQSRAVWEQFGNLVPALKRSSREIQEFGTATWLMTAAGQPSRSEPGALGAAQMLQMTFWLKAAGTDRLWHWSPLDTEIRDAAGILRSLPTGQAWIYSVLEYMAGGGAFLSPIASLGDGVKRLAVGSVQDDATIVLASAYHPSGDSMPAKTIEFRIPASFMRQTPRIARLNAADCVHSLIRNDLANANLLLPAFASNPRFLGYVREMEKSSEGEVLAWQNKSKYLEAWKNSLTLRPMTEQDGSIEGNICRLQMATPEVVALVL
jgi:hypothetical protein